MTREAVVQCKSLICRTTSFKLSRSYANAVRTTLHICYIVLKYVSALRAIKIPVLSRASQ